MRRARSTLVALTALASATGGAAVAQDGAPVPGEGPVVLTADRMDYDRPRQTTTAVGNVEVSRGGRRLLADRLVYAIAADRVTAEGNVVLLEPSRDTLFADRVELTGDLREGAVRRLKILLSDDSRATAARGTRVNGNTTVAEDVTYSPCALCPDGGAPLWQLRAAKMTHDQAAKSITYRNAFFDLFGVPVLYTPYLSHPDPSVTKKSGFLAPTFRTDTELGQAVSTPYFFNLAPNYDVTLSPIFTTDAGQVLAGEYRQLFRSGQLRAFGSIVDSPEDEATGEKAGVKGNIDAKGRFAIDRQRRWGFDVERSSDETYLRRYDFSQESLLTSRLFVERAWDANYAILDSYLFQGLRPFDDQDTLPMVLPVAEASLASDPGPLGSYFEGYGNILNIARTEGLDTRRLSGSGGFVLPHIGPLGDVYRLTTTLRGDVYYTQGNPVTQGSQGGEDVNGRVFPQFTLDWSWPLVADSIMGFSPTVEPVVAVNYNPSVNNDDEIPNEDSEDFEFDATNLFLPQRFPGLDLVEEGMRVAYGLRLGAYGPLGGSLTALIGQNYSFQDETAFEEAAGIGDGASDYVGRVDLAPNPNLAFTYRFRLDQQNLAPNRTEVGVRAGNSRVRVDLGYLSLEDDPLGEAQDDFRVDKRRELTAGVVLGITPAVSVSARTRQDLENNRSVSESFGVVYRNICLVLAAGIERSNTRTRTEDSATTVAVRLTLKNLGEIGTDGSLFGGG